VVETARKEQMMVTEKVALITGGTDGIGKATARRLLSDGWEVVVVGRSTEKCKATVAELGAVSAKGRISSIAGDLRLMSDVKLVAETYRATHSMLHFLFLNANAIAQERSLTREGFEANHAIGYFGRVLLTWLLEDMLRATPEAQVLTVVGLNLERIDFDDLTMEKRFRDMSALGRWQWAMQVFVREFNRRGIVPMNVYMPGLVRTKILSKEPLPMRAIVRLASLFVGIPAEKSADEVVRVIEEIVRNRSRDCYYARTKLMPPRDLKTEPADGERLWVLTERLLHEYRATRRSAAAPAYQSRQDGSERVVCRCDKAGT
jgi:NAD(P)-dependent dehydrogenase (short-subunit alcohol dehydrogenase family)